MNGEGVFVIALVFLAAGMIGYAFGYDDAMKEAFDRGYAVECLSKQGYYGECEE